MRLLALDFELFIGWRRQKMGEGDDFLELTAFRSISTASNLAASTVLEQRIAHRKVRPYRDTSQEKN